jgi:hypothetical protein
MLDPYWITVGAWLLCMVGWAYTTWRWVLAVADAERLDAEVAYLRGELLDVHGSTDWEW